jgi:hypothetical protein
MRGEGEHKQATYLSQVRKGAVVEKDEVRDQHWLFIQNLRGFLHDEFLLARAALYATEKGVDRQRA